MSDDRPIRGRSGRRHDVGAFDLARVGAIVRGDGTVEVTGIGAGALDDRVTSVPRLVHPLTAHGSGARRRRRRAPGLVRAVGRRAARRGRVVTDVGEPERVPIDFAA